MLVIVFAPIIGCTKKKEKRYGHMLRAEEFTSRHAVTLGDKGGGRNAFYPPSLEFWILASLFTCFLLLRVLPLSRLFSLLLPQEQRIMLFRFAYTFHRLLLYISDTISISLPDSRRANRILSFHLSLFPVPFVRLIANYRKK